MSILFSLALPLGLLAISFAMVLRSAGGASSRARADLAAVLSQALRRRGADPALAGASVALALRQGLPPEIEVSGGSAHGRIALADEIGALLERVGGLADAATLPGPVIWTVRLGPDGRLLG